MNCTQCHTPAADCIARDGTRLCETCLYERVEAERDALLGEVIAMRAERRTTRAYVSSLENVAQLVREYGEAVDAFRSSQHRNDSDILRAHAEASTARDALFVAVDRLRKEDV